MPYALSTHDLKQARILPNVQIDISCLKDTHGYFLMGEGIRQHSSRQLDY